MNKYTPLLAIALVFFGNNMEGMGQKTFRQRREEATLLSSTDSAQSESFSEGYKQSFSDAQKTIHQTLQCIAKKILPENFDDATPEHIQEGPNQALALLEHFGQTSNLLPKPNGNFTPRNVSLSSGDHSDTFTQFKKSFPFSRAQIAASTSAFLATLELGIAIGELQKEDAFNKNRFYKYPWLIAARTATNIGSRPIQLCKAIKNIFHRG
jgi:hypothetical protein